MTSRPNTESRLISALINTQDVEAARLYGVTPEMFLAHQGEYRWLTAFPGQYGHQPSVESLRSKFPDLPYSEAYVDVAFASDEVRGKHSHRQMVTAWKGAGEALRNGDTDEAFAFFASIQHPANIPSRRLRNALYEEAFLDSYDEKIDRIELPWKCVQRVTGGLAPGDVAVIAARLKQGKSWTLMSAVIHALLAGRRVTMFSLEMPEVQVLTRAHVMLAQELGIEVKHSELHNRTYPKHAYRSLLGRIKEEVPGELFVVDTSKGSISTATVASMGTDTDLVVIDHLGLMSSPMGKRAVDDWREMAMISNIVKEIAQVNKVPIFAAAQINREGDTSSTRPPKTKNLAQSDAIGQDLDLLLTMKRRSKNVAIYSVEENRHGEAGDLFYTRFTPNEGRFEEITKERADALIEKDLDQQEESL